MDHVAITFSGENWRWQPAAGQWTLGTGGVTPPDVKREGDGATPLGTWRILHGYYRPDRVTGLATDLNMHALSPEDGWCDAPDDQAYNLPVRLPYPARHERLWRDDDLYDLILVIDYNAGPVIPGAGSAIFIHRRPSDGRPTAGCIGLAWDDLWSLTRRLKPGDTVAISTD